MVQQKKSRARESDEEGSIVQYPSLGRANRMHKQVCPYKSNYCIRPDSSVGTVATKNIQVPWLRLCLPSKLLKRTFFLPTAKHADPLEIHRLSLFIN